MAFIQTISFTTSRVDELTALSEEFQREHADTAPGFKGSRILQDRDHDGAFMVIAEFESYELAMENSAQPDTDAFAKKMGELVDGDVAYGNYDVVQEL